MESRKTERTGKQGGCVARKSIGKLGSKGEVEIYPEKLDELFGYP
jgi:hypothetical protein